MMWQPIETIPQDGQLKLFCNRAGQVFVAPALASSSSREERLRIYQDAATWPNAKYTPTHWMPLPAPPQTNAIEALAEAVAELCDVVQDLDPGRPNTYENVAAKLAEARGTIRNEE